MVGEDAAIGTLVLTLVAEDGDSGAARPVVYEMVQSESWCRGGGGEEGPLQSYCIMRSP